MAWLSPTIAPVVSLAQVPDDIAWLELGTLTLRLVDDRQYQIRPTALEGAAGARQLLKFDVLT